MSSVKCVVKCVEAPHIADIAGCVSSVSSMSSVEYVKCRVCQVCRGTTYCYSTRTTYCCGIAVVPHFAIPEALHGGLSVSLSVGVGVSVDASYSHGEDQ